MNTRERYFLKYLELRYSPGTIRQYMWAMHSFDDLLETQEDVNNFVREKVYKRTNNPFYIGFLKAYLECFQLNFKIIKSKRKKPKTIKEYKFLTQEQVQFIIQYTTPRISLITRIFWESGLRLRELIDMEIGGINLSERTLKGIGKGGRPFKVFISKRTALLVDRYLKRNRRTYPFHSDDTDKDHAKSYYYYLRKECEELLLENIHPHRIRHALGHHLRADKKFDLQQIKTVLRHSKLETTDIYTEATEKEVEDKVRKEVFEEV